MTHVQKLINENMLFVGSTMVCSSKYSYEWLSGCSNYIYRPTVGRMWQWTSASLLLHVCVNVQRAPGKTWVSLSSPRAWPSHVTTDLDCVLLAKLFNTEWYRAAIQYPVTPWHAIRRVRLARHPSFSLVLPLSLLLFNAHEKKQGCYLANFWQFNGTLPRFTARFRETVINE